MNHTTIDINKKGNLFHNSNKGNDATSLYYQDKDNKNQTKLSQFDKSISSKFRSKKFSCALPLD